MRNILIALAIFTLAACSSSEQHTSRAKEFISGSDYTSATIELRNALQLDAASAEARWLLGKIYLDSGDIPTAQKELQKALELGWAPDDVRPALAKALLAQGKFEESLALEHKDLNPSAAALLLSSQAKAALASNEGDKARELLALALGKNSQLLEVKLAEATYAVSQRDPASALLLIEAILASTPDCGEAWGLKGQALGQQGKLEEARAAFDQSIAYKGIAFADRIARALINLQLLDYEAAQDDATELLKRFPKNPSVNYIQGLIYFQHQQIRKAIVALTLAAPAARQFPLILYYLSIGYLIEKDLDVAEKFGRQLVSLASDNSNGRQLLATILVEQGKVKEAQEMLQPALDENPDDVAMLNIMANALLLDDQAERGLVLYARIMQLQPDWHFVPLRMESGLVTSGADGEASIVQPATVDARANFPQTDILLILSYLAKKDFQNAIDAARSYQFRDPESLAPYHVLGGVHLAAGEHKEARAVFEKALKREPGDHFANQSLAQLALDAGNPEAARQYYEVILENHPDELTTLLQLAALEARDHNDAAMVAQLKQAIAVHPTVLEPRLRLASYYLGAGSPDQVIPLFAALTGLQQRSPRVMELTALAQLSQRESANAVATLQRLVAANPESAQYHFLLAKASSEVGDVQKTKQELMAAIQCDPNYLPALINLAGMAKHHGESRKFERYLETLIALAPEEPEVLRLRAASAQANGNVSEALSLSQRAFAQAPASGAVLELAALQKAAGQDEEARNSLKRWINDHPMDVAVRLVLGNSLERDNDIPGAQAQYLAVLKLDPDNINALNNTAWNLRVENPKKALEYIQRALIVAPENPNLLDTIAVVKHLAGDNRSAHRDIQRALEGSPENLTMRFHQAMIESALGEKAQAIATLEELTVQDGNSFPERPEAEKLLLTLK